MLLKSPLFHIIKSFYIFVEPLVGVNSFSFVHNVFFFLNLCLILALLLSIPALLCRQLHRSCIVSCSLPRPPPLMEPDQRLEAHLIREPVSIIALDRDGKLMPLEQRPRLPPGIAVPVHAGLSCQRLSLPPPRSSQGQGRKHPA